jgi:curli biogenesis system outer membrane secretion channel CsgG
LALTAFAVSQLCAAAQLDKLPKYTGPKRRIAVTEIEFKVGSADISASSDPSLAQVTPPSDFGQGLTEMLTTALSKSNRFVLVERSDKGLQDIQKEQTQPGVTDATRVQPNNFMGAEVLIRGAVTEFNSSQSKSDSKGLLSGIGIGQSSSSSTVGIDIRIYDVSTGEILDSERAEGRVSAHGIDLSFTNNQYDFGSSSFQNSTLGKATRQAIDKAVFFVCSKLDKRPWQARIAEVVDDEADKKQLYLNVGAVAGIKVGDEFEIYHPGKTIMDPDHPGRVLATTKGKRIGRCKVLSVDPEVSIAAPIEGDGFAPRDVIRLPEPPAKADSKGQNQP